MPDAAQSMPDAAQSMPDAAHSMPDAAQSMPDAAQSMPDTAEASMLHVEGVRATAEMRPAEGERLLRAALRRLPPRSSTAATRALHGRILLSLAHAQAEQGR